MASVILQEDSGRTMQEDGYALLLEQSIYESSFSEEIIVRDDFSIHRVLVRSHIEAIIIVDAFYKGFVFYKTFNEVVSIVDSIRKLSSRMLLEGITIIDNITKRLSRVLREVIQTNDIISFFKRARGYILGRNKDTNTITGSRNSVLGRNRDTGISIGKNKQ